MNFILIQQIRLLHALTESGYQIFIPSSEIYKITPLQKKFGLKVYPYNGEEIPDITREIVIKHNIPETKIRSLTRPLIFPNDITNYCRQIWKKERKNKFLFIGFITENRKILFEKWIYINWNKQSISFMPENYSLLYRLKRKIVLQFNLPINLHYQVGDLKIGSSTMGRNFPNKSWDQRYYKDLANSQFVICPEGDFVWSYRFFESILCGAIPIIETPCKIYEGFLYYKMEDRIKDLEWTKKDAEYNYKLCIERITLSKDSLFKEINCIIKSL